MLPDQQAYAILKFPSPLQGNIAFGIFVEIGENLYTLASAISPGPTKICQFGRWIKEQPKKAKCHPFNWVKLHHFMNFHTLDCVCRGHTLDRKYTRVAQKISNSLPNSKNSNIPSYVYW